MTAMAQRWGGMEVLGVGGLGGWFSRAESAEDAEVWGWGDFGLGMGSRRERRGRRGLGTWVGEDFG